MAKSKRKKNRKKRVEKVVWSHDEEAVLRNAREEWLDLESKDERYEFCTRVGEEIRALLPEKFGHLVVGRNRQLKEEWERRFRVSPYCHKYQSDWMSSSV